MSLLLFFLLGGFFFCGFCLVLIGLWVMARFLIALLKSISGHQSKQKHTTPEPLVVIDDSVFLRDESAQPPPIRQGNQGKGSDRAPAKDSNKPPS